MKFFTRFFIFAFAASLLMFCSSNKEAKEENLLTDEELFQQGVELMQSKQYDAALQTFQQLLDNYPTSDLHIDAKLYIAQAYGAKENYEQQMHTLLQLLNENIIPERVPNIFVQVGKFYEVFARYNPGTVTSDTTDYLTAIKYYQKAINYENSLDEQAKAEAMYRMALVEAKIGQYDQAKAHYNQIIVQYPQTPFAILARVKLQNVSDTSELAMDEASIELYRQQLGLSALPQEQTPTATQEQNAQPQQESEVSSQEAQEALFNSDTSAVDTTGQ